eukprot:1161910-Pelagomonas_calceolata.AAC.5
MEGCAHKQQIKQNCEASAQNQGTISGLKEGLLHRGPKAVAVTGSGVTPGFAALLHRACSLASYTSCGLASQALQPCITGDLRTPRQGSLLADAVVVFQPMSKAISFAHLISWKTDLYQLSCVINSALKIFSFSQGAAQTHRLGHRAWISTSEPAT